jgi:hypothetical protein
MPGEATGVNFPKEDLIQQQFYITAAASAITSGAIADLESQFYAYVNLKSISDPLQATIDAAQTAFDEADAAWVADGSQDPSDLLDARNAAFNDLNVAHTLGDDSIAATASASETVDALRVNLATSREAAADQIARNTMILIDWVTSNGPNDALRFGEMTRQLALALLSQPSSAVLGISPTEQTKVAGKVLYDPGTGTMVAWNPDNESFETMARVGFDTFAQAIEGTSPNDSATGVAVDSTISVQFHQGLLPSKITRTNFKLMAADGTTILDTASDAVLEDDLVTVTLTFATRNNDTVYRLFVSGDEGINMLGVSLGADFLQDNGFTTVSA